MITLTVKTEDFEGNLQQEECQFHLNKVELTEIDLKLNGGIAGEMKRIEESGDSERMFKFVKELMILGYGKKSANGKSFIKNEELTEEFRYGCAMPECLVQILQDETGASVFNFIKGMMPMSSQKAINDHIKSNPELSKFITN